MRFPLIWELTEDDHWRDSFSDQRNCSEVSGKVSVHVTLEKGYIIHAVKHIFFQVSAILVKLLLAMRNKCHHEGF